MSIKLNSIRNNPSFGTIREEQKLYKDIRFDIAFDAGIVSDLSEKSSSRDLQSLFDVEAVVNSVKNILTTTPGQKLLNPDLGLDFRKFLFENISEDIAFFIGEQILLGLAVQEPRINIEDIEVIGIPDENQYNISMNISIPSLNTFNLNLKGALNNNGFTLV